MLAVTGASGRLGRLVLQHLIEHVAPTEIVALSRTPERLDSFAERGVTVRQVDFAESATLPGAFAGVARLLLISTDDIASGQRAARQTAALAAAVAAGVERIVYTSFVGAAAEAVNPVARDHGLTEAALAQSGVTWTALRNNSYAEALPMLLRPLFADGELVLPTGDARTSWIAREDCARVAAAALVMHDAPPGAVDVTGPEALSLAEVGERVARHCKRSLVVQTVTDEELRSRLVAGGMAERQALGMAGALAAIARTGYGRVTTTVAELTGHPAGRVEAAFAPLADVFAK